MKDTQELEAAASIVRSYANDENRVGQVVAQAFARFFGEAHAFFEETAFYRQCRLPAAFLDPSGKGDGSAAPRSFLFEGNVARRSYASETMERWVVNQRWELDLVRAGGAWTYVEVGVTAPSPVPSHQTLFTKFLAARNANPGETA